MMDANSELLSAICEIRDLIRIMAEPAIAERGKKLRLELLRLVGNSAAKARVVLLMDGTRTQATIRKDTGFNQGHLCTLVKQLSANNLLIGDAKQPKLAIPIPINFFEGDTE